MLSKATRSKASTNPCSAGRPLRKLREMRDLQSGKAARRDAVAYLTGAVRLLGRIIDAIVRFAGTFVFSPKSWAGVIVLGVVVVLFLVSGGLPLLNWRKARRRRKVAAEDREAAAVGASGGHGRSRESAPAVSPTAQTQTGTAPVPRGSADDDDMGDIQEILRRRGIK